MITQSELKERLHYNPETGIFTWGDRPLSMFTHTRHWRMWNKRFSGKQAGWFKPRGYIDICVSGRTYKAHRLAWLYMTGSYPENQIDHIDGNPSNNQIVNLREATQKENNCNQALRSNNVSGVVGVSWRKQSGKWHAQISAEGCNRHIGLFSDKNDAIKARKAAEKANNFHPNHGRGIVAL